MLIIKPQQSSESKKHNNSYNYDIWGYEYDKMESLQETAISITISNNYFGDISRTLKFKKHPNFDGQSLSSITDFIKNNETVINIKEKYDTQKNSFSFILFSKEDNIKAIKSLSSHKASPINHTPIKILKQSIYIYSERLSTNV